jgi:hypothetical protein
VSPKRQSVIDGLVIVMLTAVWLYEFQQTRDVILFAGFGLAIVVLLVRTIQRAKAPPVADAVAQAAEGDPAAEKLAAEERAAARLSRRLTAICLVFVLGLVLTVGVQLLAARAIVLHTENIVNDRGREVVSNHLWLGTQDLASIRAELEGSGAVASHSSTFAGGWARIRPLGFASEGLPMVDEGFIFEWELQFGWPLVVRKWTETQVLGPGGVHWAAVAGQ